MSHIQARNCNMSFAKPGNLIASQSAKG